MTVEEYSEIALSTAIYPDRGENKTYPLLGLIGETGEVCEKLKKIQRDNGGDVFVEDAAAIAKELSDVLWYLNAVCDECGLKLRDIFDTNGNRSVVSTIFDSGVLLGVRVGRAVEYALKVKPVSEILRVSLRLVLDSVKDIADEIEYSLPMLMEINATKLLSRKDRGVLGGSGDDR